MHLFNTEILIERDCDVVCFFNCGVFFFYLTLVSYDYGM